MGKQTRTRTGDCTDRRNEATGGEEQLKIESAGQLHKGAQAQIGPSLGPRNRPLGEAKLLAKLGLAQAPSEAGLPDGPSDI